jgi:AcrR family transcriptional regulator
MAPPAAPARPDDGGYPRARARTRAALLAAARQVMAERGVEAATIADIAQRAGVSPGSFYNHFGDIPAMLDALVDDLLAKFDEAVGEVADLPCTPAERFALGIDRILRLAHEDPAWAGCVIRFESTVDRMREALHERATTIVGAEVRRGLHILGVEHEAGTDLLVGTMITAGLSRMRGRATDADNPKVAELLLRALGVPADEAAEAVRIIGRGGPPAPATTTAVAAGD